MNMSEENLIYKILSICYTQAAHTVEKTIQNSKFFCKEMKYVEISPSVA